MKVKFCCDNHANIHSKKVFVFDTLKDYGYTDEEWLELSEDDKAVFVKDWAYESFDFWIEEGDDE